MRRLGRLVLVVLVAAQLGSPPAGATAQDDAGTGADAGDTFAAATAVLPQGRYEGALDADGGDRHDFFRFHLDEGSSVSIAVEVRGSSVTDPIELLDPNGVPVDVATEAMGAGLGPSSALAGDVVTSAVWDHPDDPRLVAHRALVSGDYRLHLSSERFRLSAYRICFVNCETPRAAPIELIFGGSLPSADTRVLLVPPTHGDLGNPLGATVTDYIDATLRGIRGWTAALDAFAADHPRYAYLRDITVEIEIFDRLDPVDPAGYDVVIGYVATGPVFRGVASEAPGAGALQLLGFAADVRFSGRLILLSLFAASPRAGQHLPDFPEPIDLEIVTLHEFGHTFGLGHTLTWTAEHGPDLMNSPATFVYGDGSPAGDGGERTARDCLSSLDLYGMAVLYRWLPTGSWKGSDGWVDLPADVPYEWYC